MKIHNSNNNNNDDDDDDDDDDDNNNNGHWGGTGWCLSPPREHGRSRPPESGVTPLASASSPKATPARVTA